MFFRIITVLGVFMTNENNIIGLSPTVLFVLENFVEAMRADAEIQADAIDRLEKLLLKGNVPRSDEINTAFFDLPPDDET